MWGQRSAVTDVAILGCKWGRKQPGQFSVLLPHWTGIAGSQIWLGGPWGSWVLTGSLCVPAVLGPQGKGSLYWYVANLSLHHQLWCLPLRTTPCLLLQAPGTWTSSLTITEHPKISLKPQRWWPLARRSGELLSSQHMGGSGRRMTCGPACANSWIIRQKPHHGWLSE